MNYYFLSLARKYKLINDEAIEKWSYKKLEEIENPDWWFSYLVSAKTLGSVNLILGNAASESENEELGPYFFKYESIDSWCRFLSFINKHLEFRAVIIEILENAEHSNCLESVLLFHALDKFEKSKKSSITSSSNAWIDLFENKELKYFDSYVVPFFREFEIDANVWLKSKIRYD